MQKKYAATNLNDLLNLLSSDVSTAALYDRQARSRRPTLLPLIAHPPPAIQVGLEDLDNNALIKPTARQ
jgi:hypothetical protein